MATHNRLHRESSYNVPFHYLWMWEAEVNARAPDNTCMSRCIGSCSCLWLPIKWLHQILSNPTSHSLVSSWIFTFLFKSSSESLKATSHSRTQPHTNKSRSTQTHLTGPLGSLLVSALASEQEPSFYFLLYVLHASMPTMNSSPKSSGVV